MRPESSVPALPFDQGEVSLEGCNLIEASAGTGKTYSIIRIFLRLLLEPTASGHVRRVSEILTVTFTRAATEELRERIRQLLEEAHAACLGETEAEPLVFRLIERLGAEVCRERIAAALAEFDEASVYTIHGFCQRALSDFAFEAGENAVAEVGPPQMELLEETVLDFWRRRVYPSDPAFVAHLLAQGLNPATLLPLAALAVARPDARCVHLVGESRSDAPARYAEIFEELSRLWSRERQHARALLLRAADENVLNRATYSERSIGESCTAMDALVRLGSPVPAKLPAPLERLLPQKLADRTRKGERTPQHAFFDLWERCVETAAEQHGHWMHAQNRLVLDLVETCRRELPARKDASGLLAYDDLPIRLDAALRAERTATALRAGIRRSYTCALLDEFQDTDPLQWRIFRNLFGDADAPLFLIGDPKQSIYSFRGADLDVYVEAARSADRRYTLQTNFRSTPALLRAINHLYERANPFLREGVDYLSVHAPAEPTARPLLVDESPQVPFSVLYPADERGHPAQLPKWRARETIRAAVVERVGHLLRLAADGRARLGERAIRPGDIAVLLRTNREAEEMRRALEQARIRSVLRMDKSLLASDEATELHVVLRAVENPSRVDFIREALVTDLLGRVAEDLLALEENEEALHDVALRFRYYRELWLQRGFMHMFQELLNAEGVRERLLRLPEGERRMTNVLHLAELLHREGRHRRGTELRLLDENPAGGTPEEHLIRLESDEEAVQVVTAHLSKGLQYPIVIIPFAWSVRPRENQRLHCGRLPATGELCLSSAFVQEPTADRIHAELQAQTDLATLQEELRLLYVAMTRAESHCSLVWGSIRGTLDTAPAYLLHRRAQDSWPVPAAKNACIQPEELLSDLNALVAGGGGSITAEPLNGSAPSRRETRPPATASEAELSARRFAGNLPEPYRIHSFTSLQSREPILPERPDHERLSSRLMGSVEDTTARSRDAFGFPRGSRSGVFFHHILEQYFQGQRGDLEALVREAAARFSLEDWVDVAVLMVRQTLALPLPDGVAGSAELSAERGSRLGDLAPEDCLTEMPFYYATGSDYMTGFIDLIFRHRGRYYLLDWKSNHLGDNPDDYEPERLQEAMARDAYDVQYSIYAHALDRFLRLRDPAYEYEHFGGVLYVFLRGLSAEPSWERGVHFVRPTAAEVREFAAAIERPPR